MTMACLLSGTKQTSSTLLLALGLVAFTAPFAKTQTSPKPTMTSTEAMLTLPDSPGAISSSTSVRSLSSFSPEGRVSFEPASQRSMAPLYQKHIQPGQQALLLTAGNKFTLGVRSATSPFSALGWAIAAGYAQAIDGSPHYGTNGKAYAQRLGAAAARNVSEGIFSDSIFAPIFHEDPRYYEMGRGNSPFKRIVYAATRTVITRKDDGHSTPNFSLLAGNAAGAALTNAYYPDKDRSFSQTAQTFAGAIGGSALGFIVVEFLNDTLQAVHLRKAE